MLIYLDMCCLKRPFDGQSQSRIKLETEAVLGLLQAEPAQIQFVRSRALLLENSQNPIKTRASKVEQWLRAEAMPHEDLDALEKRAAELVAVGFRNFDALHVASAEQAGASVMATCDDRLLATAVRHRGIIKVRIVGLVELAREVLP